MSFLSHSKCGGFAVPSKFLVSDQVADPILGMDWLREHRCQLGFWSGALFIGRRMIPLVKGNGATWCRRVIVAEEVVVLPKCPQDISAKTLLGDLTTRSSAWMTEARAIQAGVHLARMLVPEGLVDARVRVINLNKEAVTLEQDKLLGGPVEAGVTREPVHINGDQRSPVICEQVTEDIPRKVSSKVRKRPRKLVSKCKDLFLVNEQELGNPAIKMHLENAEQESEPVDRQSLAEQVGRMLTSSLITFKHSERACNVFQTREEHWTRKCCTCTAYKRLANNKDQKSSTWLKGVVDNLVTPYCGCRVGHHFEYCQTVRDFGDACKAMWVTLRARRKVIDRGRIRNNCPSRDKAISRLHGFGKLS